MVTEKARHCLLSVRVDLVVTELVQGEVIVVTQGEERRIRGGTCGAIPAMRETVSGVVVQAILPLAAMLICPPRSAKTALNTPCGFTLVYPLHRVTHNHLAIVHHHHHRLHPAVIPHRFTFGSRFAEEAHFAEFYGNEDFKHVCDEECEGTHSVDLEDCL